MTISNESVINKMIAELQQAKTNKHSKQIREHVRAVRSLCDLILDDSSLDSDFTVKVNQEQELKKMMGDLPRKKSVTETESEQRLIHDDANGKSIFDF